MSWLEGIQNIRLRGVISSEVIIPKEDVNDYDVWTPLLIDVREMWDSILGDKFKTIVGSGNYQRWNWDSEDLMFLGFSLPNCLGDGDMERVLAFAKDDVSFLFGLASFEVDTVNAYTDEKRTMQFSIQLNAFPKSDDPEIKSGYYLKGFFSPAQSVVMSIHEDDCNDTIFHELIHTLTEVATTMLKDTMYGGAPEIIKEEIMTHLFTDRFKSFNNISDFFTNKIKPEYKVKSGIRNPISYTVASDSSDVSNSKENRSDNRIKNLNGIELKYLSYKVPFKKVAHKVLFDKDFKKSLRLKLSDKTLTKSKKQRAVADYLISKGLLDRESKRLMEFK